MTWRDAVLLAGAVGTVLAAWLSARYAMRSSVQVANVNREVQQEQLEAANFKVITDGLRADMAAAREDAAAARAEVAELREELRARDRRDEADRAARIAHGGWDFVTLNIVHAHAQTCTDPDARAALLSVGPPPPMYAPSDI